MKAIATFFRSVRARPLAAALLIYQFVFLNIVLPGHTRGIVTMDGKHIADSCCCCCHDSVPAKADPASKQIPSKRDQENCAICQFAARIAPPPVFSCVLPELGLLEILPPAAPRRAVSIDAIHTYQSRAPPMAAV